MITRRSLTRIFLIFLLSGCVGTPPGEGVTTDSQNTDDSTNSGVASKQTETIQKDVPRNKYVFYEFSVNKPQVLQYDIISENNVTFDVFITDEKNFQNYQERSPWKYYKSGSSLNVTAAKHNFILGTDRTYYLVIDNTREGNVTTISSNQSPISISGKIELRSTN